MADRGARIKSIPQQWAGTRGRRKGVFAEAGDMPGWPVLGRRRISGELSLVWSAIIGNRSVKTILVSQRITVNVSHR